MEYAKNLKIITENLQKSTKVNFFDAPGTLGGERESDKLAHSLLDLSISFQVFLTDYIPALMKEDISKKKVDDILLDDIGNELRHIIYHIVDPKFYEYLRCLSDDKKYFHDPKRLKIIRSNLKKSKKFKSFGAATEKELELLSDALIDWEILFKLYVNDYIPRLIKGNISGMEVDDLLLKIGHVLANILHLIKNSVTYDHLVFLLDDKHY